MSRQTFNSRTTFHSAGKIKISRKKFANGTETTTLTGYPIVWNAVSSDRGGYVVKLAKDSASFSTPTLALWNHDFDKPIGGTVNNSLRILAADDIGVPVEIDLDINTTAGSDALAYVTSGLVGGMSFSMANGFEDYSESGGENGEQRVITVSKYTVDEVTITPIPAFTQSSIAEKPPEPEPVIEGLEPIATVALGMSRTTAAHQLRRNKLDMLRI